MKLAQSIERVGLQDVSLAQAASARANGCSTGGYIWLYKDADPRRAVREALELATRAGIVLPVLWIDVEDYPPGSGILPTVPTIMQALDECSAVGLRPGIYSSVGMWARIGNPSLPGVWAWVAGYVDAMPSSLDDAPQFGNLHIVGWQWTSSPIDRSIFRANATGA